MFLVPDEKISKSSLSIEAVYQVLNSRRFWSDVLPLDVAARDELIFWKSSLAAFNGQPIWSSPRATCIVFSDASSTGFGGLCTVESARR